MSFQTYDELINMDSNNHKRASSLVRTAQNSGTPVVSPDNPGYGSDPNARAAAMRRRMTAKQTIRDEQKSESDMIANQRKQIGY